jgi:hypothetical protein
VLSGVANCLKRITMIESLWVLPLVLILVVMLALGMFWAVEARTSPAAKENTNPLERQRPHDRVLRLALGTLLLVVGPSPRPRSRWNGWPTHERSVAETWDRPSANAPNTVFHYSLTPVQFRCRIAARWRYDSGRAVCPEPQSKDRRTKTLLEHAGMYPRYLRSGHSPLWSAP